MSQLYYTISLRRFFPERRKCKMRTDSLKLKSNPILIGRVCIIISFFSIVSIDAYAAQKYATNLNIDPASQSETINSAAWELQTPLPDEFDWIQLTSGEWLKGEIKVLYEGKLEFDSDELGLLKLDWGAVKQVRGHRLFSLRFEGPITIDGLLEINETTVHIGVGSDRQSFERSQLLSIAPEESKEINNWSGRLSLGFTLMNGNTDQEQYSAIANVTRRTSATRFVTDYLGTYTKTNDVETINNQRLTSYFDVFRTKKYFLRPIFGDYYMDPFKNVGQQVTIGPGIGYHIIDTSGTEWDVSGGPAYRWTRFDSVENGQNQDESTLALMAGTHFNAELTKIVTFDFLFNFVIVNERSGTYTHHLVAAFENELTSWLSLDISFVWDKIQDPQPKADGTLPEQNDYYMIFGLGIDF